MGGSPLLADASLYSAIAGNSLAGTRIPTASIACTNTSARFDSTSYAKGVAVLAL